MLMRDFSSIDIYSKSNLQNIRNEVSQKKTQAMHSMNMFLLFACAMGLSHYSALRKSQTKQV